MGLIDNFKKRLTRLLTTNTDALYNPFNDAFTFGVNGAGAEYDVEGTTYIEEGYNENSDVYAIVQQMASKTASIPIYIKEVEDESSAKKLRRLREVTNYQMTMTQKVQHNLLETKAFKSEEFDMPMNRPNAYQTWTEFLMLYKIFIRLTGNAYIYMLTVEDGPDQGMPMAVYLLPSHQMQIVLKHNPQFLGVEDPVEGYMLIWGRSYLEFSNEDVIHIKFPNPNYGQSGEHLYGQSPLRAALKDIETSNIGTDLNIKTLKSGGAFGFIHGDAQMPISAEQARELKDRLLEMNSDPGDLGKIAGVSAKMGFTRISLTSDELKPFDYLKFSQKQICNVLGWSDALLNNDDGGKYDKQKEERKRVITDNIVPDLNLLIDALNEEFVPRFKGYENKKMEFDIMELPEMQDDAGSLSQWLYAGLDKGVFSRNEIRTALRWDESEDDAMNQVTVASDIITLEEALANDFEVPDVEKSQLYDLLEKKKVKAGFDPNQPRDEGGKWTDSGSMVWSAEDEAELQRVLAEEANQPKKEPKNVQEFEKSIKDKIHEYAGYFDAEGKWVFSHTDGNRNSVNFGYDHYDYFEMFPGGTLTHNHPNRSTFSGADATFLLTEPIGKMRVINRAGETFELTKKKFDWAGFMEEYDGAPVQIFKDRFYTYQERAAKQINEMVRHQAVRNYTRAYGKDKGQSMIEGIYAQESVMVWEMLMDDPAISTILGWKKL